MSTTRYIFIEKQEKYQYFSFEKHAIFGDMSSQQNEDAQFGKKAPMPYANNEDPVVQP